MSVTFRAGDAVTLCSSQSGPQTLLTVERFTRDGKCMVLSDGSEWRPDGQRPFRAGSTYYRGPWLARTQDSDVAHITRRRAIGRIRKFANDLSADNPIPTDALQRIVDLIDEATAGAE